MTASIEYFLAPQSPWTYLGHERFVKLAKDAGATVRVMPMDLGRVFPVSGGLPLPKRAPQRQAYRLAELRRFSEHLKMPMNVQPQYFPVAGDDAARLVIAVDMQDGTDAALKIAGAAMAAVWAQQRNIADTQVLAQLLAECGLPAQRLAQAADPAVQQRYDAFTQQAIDMGVFGAPTYVTGGEMFWGQDRLDFLARKIRS